jgi:putative acetyltransferase
MVRIQEESRQDHDAIRQVNKLAFETEEEGQLIDRLRADGQIVASLVALREGKVVGHILFSELPINTGKGILPAVALAPMAVLPDAQHQGIGSALIEAGITVCRERGKLAVLVLGHEKYYPRFGFSAELAKSVHSPYSHFSASWMAKELQSGALTNISGIAHYPAAFSVVD